MDEKRKIKPMIIIVVVLSLLIVGVIVWFSVTKIDEQKNKLKLYDSYADTVEDYSFVSGSLNTIKCKTAKYNELERLYIYNDWRHSEGEDPVDLYLALWKENYSYEINRFYHPITSVSPFPQKTLPLNMEIKWLFSHYMSVGGLIGSMWLSSSHDELLISFSKCMHYDEIETLTEELAENGYAVKFCWVDTYLPQDISDNSVFAVGLSPDHNIVGYEEYIGYQRAYGFLLYDHDYKEREEYDEPAQRFIDIVSAQYDVQGNFMIDELLTIHDNLEKKGQLKVDKLEITGVVLQKIEGGKFIKSEAEEMLNKYDFIKCITS